MAVNKTLYVKDEDAPLWDKAKELAGESLSQFLTNHIKSFVHGREAEAAGNQKIILRFREAGGVPTAKSFYGRWIISTADPFERENEDSPVDDFFAVAVTAKNNIVVFQFIGPPDESGKFGWAKMMIFSSFEEAARHIIIPNDLIAAAMERMGVEVEELDI